MINDMHKRKPMSAEHRRKIGLGQLGRKRSQATRDKLSRLHKGRPSWKKGLTLEINIQDKYRLDSSTDCWVWKGGKSSDGYGAWQIGDRCTGAHRHMYEILMGKVPDGYQLDHLCQNKLCVNPKHLEIVTPAENCRRRKGTKLSMEKALKIREMYKQKTYSHSGIAKLFGVSKSVIQSILCERIWRE